MKRKIWVKNDNDTYRNYPSRGKYLFETKRFLVLAKNAPGFILWTFMREYKQNVSNIS
jgi:hypothetical protein